MEKYEIQKRPWLDDGRVWRGIKRLHCGANRRARLRMNSGLHWRCCLALRRGSRLSGN